MSMYVIPFIQDYIRMMIHSRKMNPKTLEEDGFEDVKVKYYTMMVSLHVVDRNTWEVCQDYYKVRFSRYIVFVAPQRSHCLFVCMWRRSASSTGQCLMHCLHTYKLPHITLILFLSRLPPLPGSR
jgi:hypothetical protein